MIGSKIKQKRKQMGLTLRELAERCDFSTSLLSQLERDLVEPSISTLRKISENLEVPLYYFFMEESEQHYLIKAGCHKQIGNKKSPVTYTFLSPLISNPTTPFHMVVIDFAIHPHSAMSEEPLSHDGDECIFLQSGSLLIRMPNVELQLEAGDSLYIRSRVPHEFLNQTEVLATGISCISPPSLEISSDKK